MDASSIQNAVLKSCHPVLFYDCINHWRAREWSPEGLASRAEFSDMAVYFRVGQLMPDLIGPQTKKLKTCSGVMWEKNSSYVRATLKQFSSFTTGNSDDDTCGEFSHLPPDSWVYADYKHMIELFNGYPQILDEIDWGDFGFDNRSGRETTFWLGTAGAHTPCHFDSYGCNLVAQLYGRKKWILFPPSETEYLYPTRIPFEESSVFSRVNPTNPDVTQYPLFSKAVKYEITLEPGQVLLVPKHWWHYVECVSTSISVNTWLDLSSDSVDRMEESLAAILTAALTNFFQIPATQYYNPKETPVTPNEALDLLTNSVEEFQKGKTVCYSKPSKTLCACCNRRMELLQSTSKPTTGGDNFTSKMGNTNKEDTQAEPTDLQIHLGLNLSEEKVVNAVTHPKVLSTLASLVSEISLI